MEGRKTSHPALRKALGLAPAEGGGVVVLLGVQVHQHELEPALRLLRGLREGPFRGGGGEHTESRRWTGKGPGSAVEKAHGKLSEL